MENTRTRRCARSIVLGLAMFTACALVTLAAIAPASSRVLATCTPIAYVPSVDTGQRIGQANGQSSCEAGSPSWQYTIRLLNRAGSTLTQTSGGPINGTGFVGTNWVSCAGAYLHTFLYINVGGAGKSDTSGETSACTY